MDQQVEVKFGDWIQKGFELFKANAAVLILANLVAILLAAVTFGILAGPMMAGVILITLALIDKKEPKPVVGDVFKGFNCFLQAFLFVLVVGVAEIVLSLPFRTHLLFGMAMNIIVSGVIGTIAMFSLFLIADRNMAFWPAITESFDKVKCNFWPFLGLYLVTGIIAALGMIACFIGVIITAPLYACILGVAYRDVFGPGAATPSPSSAP